MDPYIITILCEFFLEKNVWRLVLLPEVKFGGIIWRSFVITL